MTVVSTVVLGLLLVPGAASAQENPESGRITGAQFTPSENALVPPIEGENPPNGLLCLPATAPAGTEVDCGGSLDPSEVGTTEIQTDDPCGTSFSLQDVALDTGSDEDPTPQRDVELGTLEVDCSGGDGSVTEDGCTASLTAEEGQNSATFTISCEPEDSGGGGSDGGGDEGFNCEENTSGDEGDFEECEFEEDDGASPEGGIDSGGGPTADAGADPLLPVAGIGLLALTAGGAGMALRRRRHG